VNARYILPLVTALVAGAGTSIAHADVFAVTDSVVTGSQQTNILLINTSTGNLLTLPSGIDTPDNESHPSISSDGKKLVFERRSSAGSDRIIMADLSTGATSDLFTGFEAGTTHPDSPSITPDGTGVLTGGPGSGPLLTDVSNFPTGPYPHTDIAGRSQTRDPVATGSTPGSLLSFDEVGSGAGERNVRFGNIGQTSFGSGGPFGEHSAHPTIASPGGVKTIILDFAGISGGTVGTAHLLPCAPVNPVAPSCQHGTLPGTSSSFDQSRPAFTPDGRYIGFIRTFDNGTGAVGIWDSDTQTVISTSAVRPTPDDTGSLSLYERPVLTLAHVNFTGGLVDFRLLTGANVGILVQKVTGHQKLFGRTAPKLGKPRRVPLGSFKSGKRHAHWNLKVGGKKLGRGTYQVTVRALTRSGRIRDLGKPQLLHIKH
jgi:WD40-like Beta Propeller Repeat